MDKDSGSRNRVEVHPDGGSAKVEPPALSHTPGPWDYVPSTEHHGPYVTGPYGGDICDCYAMSNPSSLSVLNGGTSRPIHFQHERADANARLIAEAPSLLSALRDIVAQTEHRGKGRIAAIRILARVAIAKATS